MEKRLEEIEENFTYLKVLGDKSRVITGIKQNSKNIESGEIFAVISGEHFSGADFIEEALDKGAVAILTEEKLELEIEQIIVPDIRDVLGEISAFIYDNPSEKMNTYGITGTNGKSTTAYFIKHILEKNNRKTGLYTSAGYDLGDETMRYSYITTPEAPFLQKLLNSAHRNGCENFVLEISSHGFAYKRVYGTTLKGGLFTNLTRAHLDIHGDMEGYYRDKAKLLDLIGEEGFFVGNIDDEYSRRLIDSARKRGLEVFTYGLSEEADIYGEVISEDLNGLTGMVGFKGESSDIEIPLSGSFNLSNALGAIGIAVNTGVSLSEAANALKDSPSPQGRLEFIDEGQPFTVIVDYAHSPDSFLNVLPIIKENLSEGGKLIFVFGATGSRDRGKRPIMGNIAGKYADISVVTDENPYWENPEDIIDQIVEGFEDDNYIVIVDRESAIRWAFKSAKKDDVVLIAGKGHEDYICVRDDKIPFNDCDKSHQILREMGFEK